MNRAPDKVRGDSQNEKDNIDINTGYVVFAKTISIAIERKFILE